MTTTEETAPPQRKGGLAAQAKAARARDEALARQAAEAGTEPAPRRPAPWETPAVTMPWEIEPEAKPAAWPPVAVQQRQKENIDEDQPAGTEDRAPGGETPPDHVSADRRRAASRPHRHAQVGVGEGGAGSVLTAKEEAVIFWAWFRQGLESLMVEGGAAPNRKKVKAAHFTMWLVVKYSERGRRVFPSLDTVAVERSLSKNTVRQRLKEAVDMGLLRVAKPHTPTSTTEYEIGDPNVWSK